MKPIAKLLSAAVLIAEISVPAYAALIDRGNGMIYDSDRNITWLADANYFKTQANANSNLVSEIIVAVPTVYDTSNGLDSPSNSGQYTLTTADFDTSTGRMTWWGAMAWAQNLTYGGHSDWRLPTITDTGAPGCDFSYNGTDCGWNVNTATSELAHLWYDELGNKAYYDTSGNGPQSGSETTNTDPFTNIQVVYWSGTEFANPLLAWYFAAIGVQSSTLKNETGFAWAVHNGDVAAVPEPGTFLLLDAGLLGWLGTRRGGSWA